MLQSFRQNGILSSEKRYNLLRGCLVLSVSLFALAIPVLAASMVTINQNGHIRIVNGTNAGLNVTPAILEYGNVTWGSTVTQTISVQNTGDCIENVTATATQATHAPVIAFIPQLSPGHIQAVNATFDTKQFSAPGDYSFMITWTAKCL